MWKVRTSFFCTENTIKEKERVRIYQQKHKGAVKDTNVRELRKMSTNRLKAVNPTRFSASVKKKRCLYLEKHQLYKLSVGIYPCRR